MNLQELLSSRTFYIPSYQRAYSWKREQLDQLFKDLEELGPNEGYYLGHFMFEPPDHRGRHGVIDGQQRLTTVVLFAAALRAVWQRNEALAAQVPELEKRFLYYTGHELRLLVPEQDQTFFRSLIEGHEEALSSNAAPKSQKCLWEVWSRALECLSQVSGETAKRWLQLLSEAWITELAVSKANESGFDVTAKLRSAQIFVYHNDRGVAPTALELLKAWLIQQAYRWQPSVQLHEEPGLVRDIERSFAEINQLAERMDGVDSDSLLRHHCVSWIGWGSPQQAIEKAFAAQSTDTRLNWLATFHQQLRRSFIHAEEIWKESGQDESYANLFLLDGNEAWPLLLKLHSHHYAESGSPQVRTIRRLTEIALFRRAYANADFRSCDLQNLAQAYKGNLAQLSVELRQRAETGFKHYWRFADAFEGGLKRQWNYNALSRYLLWKYENFLRSKAKEKIMSPLDYRRSYHGKKDDQTLEHVMPQNPSEQDQASGEYEQFQLDDLHRLGNLVLMVHGKNASLGNGLPSAKANRLVQSTLLSQQAIGRLIAEDGSGWTHEKLMRREADIINFALKHWDPKTV
jgi:PAS domain-containing protein